MPRPLWQFLCESGLAYPIALIIAIPFEAAIVYPLDWASHDRLSRELLFLLTSPVLAMFWINSALVGYLASRRARLRATSLFAASRAGEWVWVVGAVYFVLGFLTYIPIGHGWARDALYELFVNSDDIGNLVTAPFLMGIAYSLTRYILRRRFEGKTARAAG